MAELGNNIVNRILEGNTADRQKPGPESTRPEREAWIFAKYRDKLFVDRDIFKAEEFKDCQAWTVKRLRRRARSRQLQRMRNGEEEEEEEEEERVEGSGGKEERDEEEKEEDSSEEPSLLESVLRASTLSSSATRPPGTATIFLFNADYFRRE
jgi:hypothetical protein